MFVYNETVISAHRSTVKMLIFPCRVLHCNCQKPAFLVFQKRVAPSQKAKLTLRDCFLCTAPPHPADQPPPTPIPPSNGNAGEFVCPLRPDHGREGKPIALRANHFHVNIPKGFIHHYNIAIVPEKCPRRVNR